MVMDIIYKNETKFDEGNNFSIDLTSNYGIQNMIFKGIKKIRLFGIQLIMETHILNWNTLMKIMCLCILKEEKLLVHDNS